MHQKIRALLLTFSGLCLAFILLSTFVVHAQDGGDDGDEEENSAIPIGFGETMEGEITNNDFAVDYVFSGDSGDVAVIEMRPIEIIESELIEVQQFDSPQVEVYDPDDNLIAQTTRYDRADLLVRLPADGDYIIRATREDGEIGISTGQYTLSLIAPEILEPGRTLDGSISHTERNYFLVSGIESFSLEYEKIDGDFFPEIAVIRMVDDDLFNDLNTFGYVAALNGTLLESGTLNIAGDGSAEGVYLILVHQAMFNFQFDDTGIEFRADYTLTVAE